MESQREAFWKASHNVCYVRQFPGIIDKKTGKPIEYEINRKIALYILDGADKAQRLQASSREHPCISYTGQSRVWREVSPVIAE